jgi:hypothetical protein
MTKRIGIAVGASLLLTIGSALGGTFMYAQTDAEGTTADAMANAQASAPTPYTIAMWKATAVSANYISPKVPL